MDQPATVPARCSHRLSRFRGYYVVEYTASISRFVVMAGCRGAGRPGGECGDELSGGGRRGREGAERGRARAAPERWGGGPFSPVPDGHSPRRLTSCVPQNGNALCVAGGGSGGGGGGGGGGRGGGRGVQNAVAQQAAKVLRLRQVGMKAVTQTHLGATYGVPSLPPYLTVAPGTPTPPPNAPHRGKVARVAFESSHRVHDVVGVCGGGDVTTRAREQQHSLRGTRATRTPQNQHKD
eukprot:363022-Chlamydomonas_euryale.AAC.3